MSERLQAKITGEKLILDAIENGLVLVVDELDSNIHPRLVNEIYNRLDHHSPAMEESSTTVFRLVEEYI